MSLRRSGITLIEVLVAIFIVGVGLLALLNLFPVGALELAQAIKDDRTAAIADQAAAMSHAGEDLLQRTADFVIASLGKGSVDTDVASRLREEYEDLAKQAADLEVRLEDLRGVFPPDQIQPYLGPLLAQIRAIRLRIHPVVRILLLIEK